MWVEWGSCECRLNSRISRMFPWHSLLWTLFPVSGPRIQVGQCYCAAGRWWEEKKLGGWVTCPFVDVFSHRVCCRSSLLCRGETYSISHYYSIEGRCTCHGSVRGVGRGCGWPCPSHAHGCHWAWFLFLFFSSYERSFIYLTLTTLNTMACGFYATLLDFLVPLIIIISKY